MKLMVSQNEVDSLKTPQTNDIFQNINDTNTYSQDRLIAYFDSLEAAKMQGYTITADNNIFIEYRTIEGNPITYTPKSVREQINKIENNRRYGTVGDGAEYLRKQEHSVIYGRTRYATGTTRYKEPSKVETGMESVAFLPMPKVIQAYIKGTPIKSLHITEGEFKGSTLDVNGLYASSFSGISRFKLTQEIKQLVLKNKLRWINLMYDGDLKDLSKDPFKEVDENGRQVYANTRNLGFYHSMRKFAKELFEWLQELNKDRDEKNKVKVKLTVSFPNTNQEKAIDDMILANPSQAPNIICAIKEGKNNNYFSIVKLSKTTYEQKLKKLFAFNSVRNFYNRHKNVLQNKPFRFSHDGIGVTYQYDTNKNALIVKKSPFYIDINPLFYLKGKKYIGDKKGNLDRILEAYDHHDRLALVFPTGTGKTTIAKVIAKHHIDQDPTNKAKVYIVVPYTRLGMQIAKDTQKQFIYANKKDYTHKPTAKERQQERKEQQREVMAKVVKYQQHFPKMPMEYKPINVKEESKLRNERIRIQSTIQNTTDPQRLEYLYNRLKEIRAKQRETISPIHSNKIDENAAPYIYKHNTNKVNYDERIIICSCDAIKSGKIQVGENDLLIIDEAHDLVNHYGFRSETMNAVYRSFNKAQKVIYLSATPNMNFLKNENFKVITGDVQERIHVNYLPHILGEKQTIKQTIIKKILDTDLSKKIKLEGKNLFDKKEQHKIHIVFINDKSQLEDIRNYLIDTGVVKLEETALLTSDRQNKEITFMDIIESAQIGDKVKIIFTTCILSEGVNIKNKNIGEILMGNVKDIDLLRQFPYRFRSMKELNVHLFYKEQKNIDSRYFEPTQRATQHLMIQAKAHAQILQSLVDEANINGETFEANIYHSEICELAFIDEKGKVHIDNLKIYAKEKQRRTNCIPIDLLIAELAALDHVTIITEQECQETTDSHKIESKLKELKKERVKTQVERKERILKDIAINKEVTLQALKANAILQKKFTLVNKVDEDLPIEQEQQDVIKPQIEAYQEANHDLLNCDTYSKILNQYVTLLKWTDDPTTLIKTLDAKKDFNILVKSLEWLKWIDDYQDKNRRQRRLNITQRADAKGLLTIQKKVMEHFKNKQFSIGEMYIVIKRLFNVKFVNKLGQLQTAYSTLSESKLKNIFLCLFEADKLAPDIYTNIRLKTYEDVLKTTQKG